MKEIQLTKGQITLIDDEMFDRVNYFKWCALTHGDSFYAVSSIVLDGRYHFIYMHRLIMGFPDSIIDHADGNKLNNQCYKLRYATKSQNSMNSKKMIGTSSMYKGVSWVPMRGRWLSQVVVNGSHYHIGYFTSEIDAGIAYNNEIIKYHGEFARLNLI